MTKEEMKNMPKTGTTTVGIVCKDGIVLAADKRMTAGYIAHTKVEKIIQIADNMAVTIAGMVSEVQLLSKLIKAELKLKDMQTYRQSTVKEAANLLAGLVYSNVRKMSMVPSIAAFLLGGYDKTGGHLYGLGIDGSVTDYDEYTTDGSGCMFALGVLEALYKKGMSVDEGVKLAVKAINSAIQRDPSSGNGILVVTLTDKGVKRVLDKQVDTRLEA
ncbi:proteasome subunit beta [Candidatus Woesearchaeota archaeon]|nr:proteasome subunit beta [Candidatus Woesearchaeota archaeon]